MIGRGSPVNENRLGSRNQRKLLYFYSIIMLPLVGEDTTKRSLERY